MHIVSHLLDHDTPQWSVSPAHNGDPQAGGGAGNLHMWHLTLQDWQPGDACNDDNDTNDTTIKDTLYIYIIPVKDL